ncbi:MAG TPA: amino acid adenylation domain-containing protein [Ktedonobacterales bacterium]|nr:amino acid adenylation domain-containing protein [Ktedonobacterales bacterium]
MNTDIPHNLPTPDAQSEVSARPFDACLRQLAEQRIILSASAGRVVYDPLPAPELTAALAPFEPAIVDALQHSGGAVTWGPMTPNQEAMWLLQSVALDTVAYNQAAAFKVFLPLDRAALTHAVAEITRYTDVIRACYVMVDGTPVQQVRVEALTPLTIEDAHGWDDAQLEARISEILHQPYRLDRPGLFHAHAFDLGDGSHAVMVRAHHIVADLWSLNLLLEHVCRVYAAAREGDWLRLPKPAFSYPTYALAQRDLLEGPRGVELRDYWAEQLADAQPGLDLPADYPRPAQPTGRGAMAHFELAHERAEALRATARALHTTPYTLMLSAFQVMCFRLSGQRDVLTGTPMHGRRDRRTRETIGYLSNMTVLRNRFDPQETVAEVIERMRGVVNGALLRHDYPFPLVAELAPGEREPGRPLLVETSFTLLQSLDAQGAIAAFPLDQRGVRFELSGLQLETLATRPRFSPFDLSLLAAQLETTFACAWQYDTDLFSAATIERYTERFTTLLDAIAANPYQPIGELEMLGHEERAQLDTWNATRTPFDLRLRVTDLFANSVSADPAAVAVDDSQRPLTYGALERLSNQISRALRARGVGRGAFVGVRLRRAPETLAVLLGILSAGAAYLPLDPDYPAARLAFMLADSGAALVISDAADDAEAPDDCQVVTLDALLADAAARDPEPMAVLEAGPEDPAYILYTSGSTGQPKGVVIPHRALTNFLLSMRRALEPTADDRVLALTSISFDIAALELYLPLVVGARIRIATHDEAADAFRLTALLRDWRPTLVQATPATWTMLLEAGWEGDSSLTALCGGEALTRDLADALLARAGVVWNMYGPTETTVWSTMRRVEAGEGPVTIGYPIANTTCYALDACGAEAAVGAPGELAIGGAGVALGYHRRTELTAERFIWRGGERLYRTGDRVVRRHDGALAYLGRLDGQIKLHGRRIELGEIESALRAAPAVTQAAARLFGPEQPHRLVGYLVPRQGEEVDLARVRETLRARLPEYMIPSALLTLDALPLTPNQKVNRAALPAPALTVTAGIAPLTNDEARIAAIWSDLLHVEVTDPIADFFACGGHSLALMSMLARVQRAFGRELSVALFLRQPTVAWLARMATSDADEAPSTGEIESLCDRDAALVDWPAPTRTSMAPHLPPRAILLTGATGFLGAHLLDALLRRTNAVIYCLARGTHETIMRQLRAYGLGLTARSQSCRIIAIAGDLAQPNCGLSDGDWRLLADGVDLIVHCGALVNFVYPYEALRPANVEGTRTLLRLALEGRAKAFHFISTFSVFDSPEYADRTRRILESEFPRSGHALAHAYGQSKWASEALVRRAASEHGLPVAIYRPGRVSGHSQTGQGNPSDLLEQLLAGCIELGVAPDLPVTLDMTPVDYVADATVELTCQPVRGGACPTYHLVNPRPTSSATLVSVLRRRGYPLPALHYDAWRERIQRAQPKRLISLLPLFTDELPAVLVGAPDFDTTETERGLAGSGITCPPADEGLLNRYISYLIASDEWPVPVARLRGETSAHQG